MINYTRIERNNRVALVRTRDAEQIAGALIEGEGCTPADSIGRGALMRFPYSGGVGLVRRYRRGGLMCRFIEDAYVLANRPLREFMLHKHVEEHGLPAPPLLGVCWSRKGVLFRGAIATGEVPDAVDLDAYLRVHPDDVDMLKACGALIRQMHEMRIWHADLQVKNILVAPDGPRLIDFDNARLLSRISPNQCARNLFRLRRSFEKRGFGRECFSAVLEGYGSAPLPSWLGCAYQAKAWVSDHLAGRSSS